MASLESSGHKIGHKRESVADMKRAKRTYRPFEVDEALLLYACSRSMATAAGRLGIPEGTLYSWIHGANGKPGKYTERFKEIQGIKKGEREKQMSILLWYAFRGMPKKALGTMSIRRNELVSDLFSRIHKVERIGMGIKRIRKALREAGLKEPEFETNGFFKIVIHRSPEFAMKDAGKQPESQLKSRLESQPESLGQRVLNLLNKEPLSKSDLSRMLGQKSTSGQLHKVIRDLLAASLIERTIPDKPNSRLQKYRLTLAGKKAVVK